MSRGQSARQHCWLPHDLPWMNMGLEMARSSSYFLRPRLTDLIANPLQTELHPLQMPKRNVITALLIEAATWSAR